MKPTEPHIRTEPYVACARSATRIDKVSSSGVEDSMKKYSMSMKMNALIYPLVPKMPILDNIVMPHKQKNNELQRLITIADISPHRLGEYRDERSDHHQQPDLRRRIAALPQI